ncbi:MAG: phospholipid carrier-dependent glycosyltransferase [Bacteroidota bacterium]
MMSSIKPTNSIKIAFFFLLAIGVFLRIFKLGLIPVGLNADEASIGYEAYSILKTGADRWGIQLPPYFLSFGSGQNTLYAYLSVPFLYFFDLNQHSIRLLSAFLGLGTIPLVYLFAKLLFKNYYFVLAATLLYLFDPYLFMISRWALEYNILPFFVIFSLYLFTKTFLTISSEEKLNFSKKLILIFSFPSLALIIYTYASALFIIPAFMGLIFIYFWQDIKRHKLLFSASIALFFFILCPFILFILKNHVLKTELAIEQYLPFEIPKMLSNREEVYKGFGKNLALIKKNFIFVFSGFKEFDRAINTTKFFTPHFFLVFSLLGLIYLAQQAYNQLNNQFKVLYFWSLSCLIPFLLFEMNLNRSVHLQAVVPILSLIGVFIFMENILDTRFKKQLLCAFIGLFCIQSVIFYGEYFYRFRNYDQFVTNFDGAIKVANQSKKPSEKIVITSQLVFNYLFVGFYEKYPPALLHKTLKADFSHPNVAVHSFEGYYILGDYANEGYYLNAEVFDRIKKEKSFLALLAQNEKIEDYKINDKSLIDTSLYSQKNIYKSTEWKVVAFNKK